MHIAASCLLIVMAAGQAAGQEGPHVRLSEWERGFAVNSLQRDGMSVYLWFYEWHMFDAIKPGQHTGGTYKLPRRLDDEGKRGVMASDALNLKMTATRDGADLQLTVRNLTDYDFPPLAAIIPCFNPGPADNKNEQFANTNTYFLAGDGLQRLHKREIHFNAALRNQVDGAARGGRYAWSEKWPLAQSNVVGGLIVRESTDGQWVCGIAWDDFLSAQGHNPWQCMHLSIRVGPLPRGESKTIRGKVYLLKGDKRSLLKRYREDFAVNVQP